MEVLCCGGSNAIELCDETCNIRFLLWIATHETEKESQVHSKKPSSIYVGAFEKRVILFELLS